MKRLWRAARIAGRGMWLRAKQWVAGMMRQRELERSLDLIEAAMRGKDGERSFGRFHSLWGFLKGALTFSDRGAVQLFGWLCLLGAWGAHAWQLTFIYDMSPRFTQQLPWPFPLELYAGLGIVIGSIVGPCAVLLGIFDTIKSRRQEIKHLAERLKHPERLVKDLRLNVYDALGIAQLNVYADDNVFTRMVARINGQLRLAEEQCAHRKNGPPEKLARAERVRDALRAAQRSIEAQQQAIHRLFERALALFDGIGPQFTDMVMDAQLHLLEAEVDRISVEVPRLTRQYLAHVLTKLDTLQDMVRKVAASSILDQSIDADDIIAASDAIVAREVPLVAAAMEAQDVLNELADNALEAA